MTRRLSSPIPLLALFAAAPAFAQAPASAPAPRQVPMLSPAPGGEVPSADPAAAEGGADNTDAIIASLTPPIPAETLTRETLQATVAGLGAPGLREPGRGEAALERLVRSSWPDAERQEVRIQWRDITRFDVKAEYGAGMATPQVYPFYFSAMPSGELKLKFIQFLGAGEDADFPPPEKAAQSLGVVVLADKLKPREAQEKVLAIIARAEARGLGALCITGASEFTDFDFGLITTSAARPPAAENEIDQLRRVKRFTAMGHYLAGKQAGLDLAVRKLPVFFSTTSTWKVFTEDPRVKKSVRMSKLTVSGAADTGAAATANFVLKVPGANPERVREWIHVSADWDGRPGLPDATGAAAVAGVLELGRYFKAHPAPRSMVFSLLGGSVWGGLGADAFMSGWPQDQSIFWHLTATALGRMESAETGAVQPSKLILLGGWTSSKSVADRWQSIVGPFKEIGKQYELDGAFFSTNKEDRQLAELNCSFPVLLRLRRGYTVLTITGASPAYLYQPLDTADKLLYDQLALQVRALGHFAQKLASPS